MSDNLKSSSKIAFELIDFLKRSSLGSSVFLSLFFWLIPQSQAFEFLPEYRSLQKPKLAETQYDLDPDINGEYNSDLLTYWKPLDWRRTFHQSQNHLQIAYGSLDSKIFYVGNQLKLQKELTQNLELSFIHFSQKDFEQEEENTFFELSYDFSLLNLHVYHSSFHEKKENDLGLALSFEPQTDHSLRFFHTWVDYSRHKRNELNDRFEEDHKPRSFGLVGRWIPGSQKTSFLEYSVRRESPTEWTFPDENRRYDYAKTLAAIHYIQELKPDFDLSYRAEWSQNEEVLRDTQSLADPLAQKDFQKHMQYISGRFKKVRHGSDSLKVGLLWTQREWELEDGDTKREGLSPHLIWYSFFEDFKSLDLGYEATLHEENSSSFKAEHRFNLWWNYQPSEDQLLRLIFTADLDEFGSSSTWEGGSVQWQANF